MARVPRRTLATMAALALALAFAGPAAAAKPERVPVPQEVFVISGFCDFDVLVEALASKTYDTTFFDRMATRCAITEPAGSSSGSRTSTPVGRSS